MGDDKQSSDQPELTIKAGAWIGLAGIALTMILALLGAAGWIVSRIDRVETKIDDLDKRVDALAVDMARMSGQLDLILQQGLSGPGGPAAETTSPGSGEMRSAARPKVGRGTAAAQTPSRRFCRDRQYKLAG